MKNKSLKNYRIDYVVVGFVVVAAKNKEAALKIGKTRLEGQLWPIRKLKAAAFELK